MSRRQFTKGPYDRHASDIAASWNDDEEEDEDEVYYGEDENQMHLPQRNFSMSQNVERQRDHTPTVVSTPTPIRLRPRRRRRSVEDPSFGPQHGFYSNIFAEELLAVGPQKDGATEEHGRPRKDSDDGNDDDGNEEDDTDDDDEDAFASLRLYLGTDAEPSSHLGSKPLLDANQTQQFRPPPQETTTAMMTMTTTSNADKQKPKKIPPHLQSHLDRIDQLLQEATKAASDSKTTFSSSQEEEDDSPHAQNPAMLNDSKGFSVVHNGGDDEGFNNKRDWFRRSSSEPQRCQIEETTQATLDKKGTHLGRSKSFSLVAGKGKPDKQARGGDEFDALECNGSAGSSRRYVTPSSVASKKRKFYKGPGSYQRDDGDDDNSFRATPLSSMSHRQMRDLTRQQALQSRESKKNAVVTPSLPVATTLEISSTQSIVGSRPSHWERTVPMMCSGSAAKSQSTKVHISEAKRASPQDARPIFPRSFPDGKRNGYIPASPLQRRESLRNLSFAPSFLRKKSTPNGAQAKEDDLRDEVEVMAWEGEQSAFQSAPSSMHSDAFSTPVLNRQRSNKTPVADNSNESDGHTLNSNAGLGDSAHRIVRRQPLHRHASQGGSSGGPLTVRLRCIRGATAGNSVRLQLSSSFTNEENDRRQLRAKSYMDVTLLGNHLSPMGSPDSGKAALIGYVHYQRGLRIGEGPYDASGIQDDWTGSIPCLAWICFQAETLNENHDIRGGSQLRIYDAILVTRGWDELLPAVICTNVCEMSPEPLPRVPDEVKSQLQSLVGR